MSDLEEPLAAVEDTFDGYQHAQAYRFRDGDGDEGTPVTRMAPRALLGQATLCADVIEALRQNGNGRLQLERLLLGTRELRRG